MDKVEIAGAWFAAGLIAGVSLMIMFFSLGGFAI